MGRQKKCRHSGKRKYLTHELALVRGAKVMENHPERNFRAYKCEWCGWYHLTTEKARSLGRDGARPYRGKMGTARSASTPYQAGHEAGLGRFSGRDGAGKTANGF